MKWKLVGAIPKDGIVVKAIEDQEITIRGSIGKAVIVAFPRVLFEGEEEVFRNFLRKSVEVTQQTTGIEDVLAVEENLEFLRLVPVDLDERISEALGECESCCLDDKEDRKRVFETLRSKLAG